VGRILGLVVEVGDTGGIEGVPGWSEDSENKRSTGFFLLCIERAVDGVVTWWMTNFGFYVRL